MKLKIIGVLMGMVFGLVFGLIFGTENSLASGTRIDPQLNQISKTQKTEVIALFSRTNVHRVVPRSVLEAQQELRQSLAKFSVYLKSAKLRPSVEREVIEVGSNLWISQAVSFKVNREGLRQLVRSGLFESIHLNHTVQAPKPVNMPIGVRAESREQLIAYDRLNEKFPELLGQNIKIGMIDTGVDGKHESLRPKISVFYDAFLERVSTPVDRSTHGTHVAGILVCDRQDGRVMGLAPQAQLLVGGGLSFKGLLGSMQFMLDPDFNPATDDFPRVVNNSWAFSKAIDLEPFYRALDFWKQMGILPVFAAGNLGPGLRSHEKPQNHPAVLSVGAIDYERRVLSISARGPVEYRGVDQKKPEILAPGLDILSTQDGGGFRLMTGTSMAAPQVAAVAALMFQVNPKLTAEQVKTILISTASRQSDTNDEWDPAYGYGILNANEAVQKALTFSNSPL